MNYLMWIKENALSLSFSFIIFVVILFVYLSSKKAKEKNFDKAYFLVALVFMCVGLGTMILFL